MTQHLALIPNLAVAPIDNLAILAIVTGMTARRIYAISDIHGHPDEFERALSVVNLKDDPSASLILLGDYINRGPNSFRVLQMVYDLLLKFPDRVTALPGNHEIDFFEWLDGDEYDFFWLDSAESVATVSSFLSESELAEFADRAQNDPIEEVSGFAKRVLRKNHARMLSKIRRLPLFHEEEGLFFVHAGVDEDAGSNWRLETPDLVFTHKFPATTGPFEKTIVAGHFSSYMFHDEKNSDRKGSGGNNGKGSGGKNHGIYFDGQSHFFIDGTVQETKKLNVLRYETADSSFHFHDQV